MWYLYLTVAIVAEVIATSALKETQQFSKLLPSIIVVVGYGTAFYFLSIVLKSMPIGVVYAIWSGVGIALLSLVGYFVFGQKLDVAAIVGITLIVAGVVVMNVFSNTLAH
ncbi:MAG: multidrug efflux SMR transporter [Pseudomonadota bacterium]